MKCDKMFVERDVIWQLCRVNTRSCTSELFFLKASTLCINKLHEARYRNLASETAARTH